MATKTLVVFAHPAYEKSLANRALIEGIANLPGVTINDLYQLYPDFQIDVPREQALLADHHKIIFQHPLYWYSSPALLKEWLDLVLQYGWAFGPDATALQDKIARSVITTGGTCESYSPSGHNRYTVEEFLRPFEQSAQLCGMRYEPPLVFHGALNCESRSLAQTVTAYREWIEKG